MGREEAGSFSPYPPSPQNSIIIYVRDHAEIQRPDSGRLIKLPPVIFTGQHTERINSRMGRDHLMIYVGFRPGGMYRLLGIPMHEFINDEVDGKDLYGSEISEILEQLHEAGDYQELVNIVEVYLISKLDKLRSADPFDFAIQQIVQRGGNITMDEVAGLSCLSFRQFERKCMEKIGLPPKLYARITRFSRAYRMKEMNTDLPWTGLAHTCGYYDQMHMIRDFKEFTGGTPTKMERELEMTMYKLQSDLVF